MASWLLGWCAAPVVLDDDVMSVIGRLPRALRSKEDVPFFRAELVRPDATVPLGMVLEACGDAPLFVGDVHKDEDLPVNEYNRSASSSMQIRPGDYIVSINGVATRAGMVSEVSEQAVLELVVCRPKVFSVSVRRGGKPLGVTVHYDLDGVSLSVLGVAEEGALKASGADIMKGDRILAVNGKRSSPEELLEYMSSPEPTTTLLISRVVV